MLKWRQAGESGHGSSRNAHSTAVVGNIAYVIGGYTDKGVAAEAAAADAFDLSKGRWVDARDDAAAATAGIPELVGAACVDVAERGFTLVHGGELTLDGSLSDDLLRVEKKPGEPLSAGPVSRVPVAPPAAPVEEGAEAPPPAEEVDPATLPWPAARAWHAVTVVPSPPAEEKKEEEPVEDKGKKGKKGKTKAAEPEVVVEKVTGPLLVAVGGQGSGGELLNDVWAYDIDRRKWVTREVTGTAAPPPRRYHSADFHAGLRSVIVFGGVGSSGERLNDVWAFNVDSWSWRELDTYGDVPSPRCWHATAVATLPDYSLPPTPAKPAPPVVEEAADESKDKGKGKGKAAAAAPEEPEEAVLPEEPDSNRLLVLGGFSDSGLGDASELYALDLGTRSWSIIKTKGASPPTVYGGSLVVGQVTLSPDDDAAGGDGDDGVDLANTARIDALNAVASASDAADIAGGGGGGEAKAEETKGAEEESKAAGGAGGAAGDGTAQEVQRVAVIGGWDGKTRLRTSWVLDLTPWDSSADPPPEEEFGELGWGKQVYANGDVYEGRWKKNARNGIGRCKYANGDVYAGEWKDDQRWGRGVQTTAEGARYEGEWKRDVRHGKGIETFADGDPANVLGEKRFVGTFKDGGRSGHGVCEFHNGDQYEGNWRGNTRQGEGTMHYGDGGLYEGQWEENERSGHGEWTTAEGHVYLGHWLHDLCDGRGVMIYADGSEYRGLWNKGKRNGTGQMTYVNRDVYTGKWKADARFGKGTMSYASGHRYEGMWANDKQHGRGELDYADGAHYEGDFECGVRAGTGMLKEADGTTYEGEWAKDQPHGTGTRRFYRGSPPQPGDLYEGSWRRGKQHGRGVMHFANGDRYEGTWADGLRHGTGTQSYNNGEVYVGEWARGVRCGHGRLDASDPKPDSGAMEGMIWYEGGWANDGQTGQGVAEYTNGDRYEGSWEGYVRCGMGELTCADGETYVGRWRDDMREGPGTATYPDGSTYEGEWKRNRRHVRKANWKGLDDSPVEDPVLLARAAKK